MPLGVWPRPPVSPAQSCQPLAFQGPLASTLDPTLMAPCLPLGPAAKALGPIPSQERGPHKGSPWAGVPEGVLAGEGHVGWRLLWVRGGWMEPISQRPTSLLRPGQRAPRTAQLSQAWVRVPQGGEGRQSSVDNTRDRGRQSPGWEKSVAPTGTRRSPPGGSVSLQTGSLPARSLFYWDEIHAQKACTPRAQLRTVLCKLHPNKARGVPTPRGPQASWRWFPAQSGPRSHFRQEWLCPFWGVTNVTCRMGASLSHPCLLPPHLLSSRLTHTDTHMNVLLLFIPTILLLDVP